MAQVKKDGMPDGPGGLPNGDEATDEAPIGGGGADIVSIAADRLNDIVSAMGAAGGVLTADLRDGVQSVIALLEAVSPDDDMDDDDEDDLPMGPGEPTEMTARAKRREKRALVRKAWQQGRLVLTGSFVKRKLSPEAFVAKTSALMRSYAGTTRPALRKMRGAALRKMLTYGPEVFGERGFSSPSSDVPEIPVYEEAFVDQHVEANATPSEEPVKSGFAYDADYTPNENSQQQFDAGSPNFVEKRIGGVLDLLRKAADGAAAGAAACPGCGEPNEAGVEKCRKCGAPMTANMGAGPAQKLGPAGDPNGVPGSGPPEAAVDKGRLNTEKDGAWSAAYINDLPDSAFLYVEPGAAKDASGKSTPADVRHFPYKDQAGNVDLPHLRDAIGRIPDSGIADDKKTELQGKARDLLEQHEGAEKSAVEKADRGDDGWADDLASPEFLKGEKLLKPMGFGYDKLKTKQQAIEAAAAAPAK